jgi:hypothetical protein
MKYRTSKRTQRLKQKESTRKHRRQLFRFDDLVSTLDVEEKARAKDTCGKAVVGPSSVNFVQRGNLKPQNKGKKPPHNPPKANQADRAAKKKKKVLGAGHNKTCFACRSQDHFARMCPDRKMPEWANMVIIEGGGTLGYGKSLPTILLVLLTVNICIMFFWTRKRTSPPS